MSSAALITPYTGDQGDEGICAPGIARNYTIECYVYPSELFDHVDHPKHDGPSRCRHCTPVEHFSKPSENPAVRLPPMDYVRWTIPWALIIPCNECAGVYCVECLLDQLATIKNAPVEPS